MSRAGAVTSDQLLSFPRVSGDEPAAIFAVLAESLFSPRERG